MFSKKVMESLNKSSWIRAMFEEGEKLRKLHGAEKVYDFSLGNPDIEPPSKVKQALKNLVLDDTPGKHRYMSNAGFLDVRQKIASYVSKEQGTMLPAANIVMTCGAAGGINVSLKAILNPGEEVIVLSPFFVEYLSYIDNFNGIPVIVPTEDGTFEPDAQVLQNFLTPRTKAIILNTPNNPTGVVYSEQTLQRIARVIESKEKEYNTTIFVISDEPYVKIVYDGIKVPPVFKIFKNAIIINSFSKSMALPGERIGYIAVNSAIKDADSLVNALIYCNRTLGFVNAPALFQKVVAEAIDEVVDIDWYRQRRDILYAHLLKLGFSCVKPHGAFYLFPKAPIEDDVEFVKRALKYNLLLVPGRGFGCPGYVRIAYCVDMKTIENSLPAFEALAKDYKAL